MMRARPRVKPPYDLHLDIALLDVFLPGLDGIDVAKRLQADFPDTRVVVLKMDTDPEEERQLLEAGIDGFVLKEAPARDVVKAIRAAANREGLAEKTVRIHLYSIFAKMGVTVRTQAALLAVRSGLCDDAPARHTLPPTSLPSDRQ
jgi:DNA-binding NarL/FixJ family response regulator